MSAHPRHRAPRAPRRGRRIATVVLAALSVTSLATASTSATFTDTARGSLSVVAAGDFPCVYQVSAPYEFTQAPVDHGSGTWTRTSALCSPNRRWVAVFQTDGNFVLYDTATYPGTAVWATWTFAQGAGGIGGHLIFQSDGNLVVYTSGFSALRSTGTSGVAQPAHLVLQDDANLVIYDATGAARWWSAGTQTTPCRTPGAFTCNPND